MFIVVTNFNVFLYSFFESYSENLNLKNTKKTVLLKDLKF